MKKLFILISCIVLAGCAIKPLKNTLNNSVKEFVLDTPITNQVSIAWDLTNLDNIVGFNFYYSTNPASLTNLSLFNNYVDIQNANNYTVYTNEDDELTTTNYYLGYQFTNLINFTIPPPYFCMIKIQFSAASLGVKPTGTNDTGIAYVEGSCSNPVHWPVNPIGFNITWNPARTNENIRFYSSTNLALPFSKWNFETNVFGANNMFFLIDSEQKFLCAVTTNQPALKMSYNPIY